NAANEVAVEAFLAGAISFGAIPEIVERVMDTHQVCPCRDLEDVLAADRWAKDLARKLIQEGGI
ncbi:MAG: 1-deoxy-D-xylulose-5-phosphate reductoisomerase, partial [Armatimonadetes bacterium]|nr:1-deoxy-D-xylulose-5-phosphate reductoisomerase [Armatimonadota bacterium]